MFFLVWILFQWELNESIHLQVLLLYSWINKNMQKICLYHFMSNFFFLYDTATLSAISTNSKLNLKTIFRPRCFWDTSNNKQMINVFPYMDPISMKTWWVCAKALFKTLWVSFFFLYDIATLSGNIHQFKT